MLDSKPPQLEPCLPEPDPMAQARESTFPLSKPGTETEPTPSAASAAGQPHQACSDDEAGLFVDHIQALLVRLEILGVVVEQRGRESQVGRSKRWRAHDWAGSGCASLLYIFIYMQLRCIQDARPSKDALARASLSHTTLPPDCFLPDNT